MLPEKELNEQQHPPTAAAVKLHLGVGCRRIKPAEVQVNLTLRVQGAFLPRAAEEQNKWETKTP